MTALNYATQYSQALSQAFPYVLYFGELYNTPNNGRYRWVNAKMIEIPSIATTGRVDADRDTIATAARNYSNAWESKQLTNERKWSTLVHPKDIDQTGMVTTIQNITQVYNQEQKFPEMDAYTISKIYADWTGQSKTADTTVITAENVYHVFDSLMQKMTEARVPLSGRILYVTPAVDTIIKQAKELVRNLSVTGGASTVNRMVSSIDTVTITVVPSELMKTLYEFTSGWKAAAGAKQINMMLIHPLAVITPVSYTFARLDEPSALSEGKYVYYEESFEDVFILNKKADAIQINMEGGGA